MKPVYRCDGCSFMGTAEEVEKHEQTCEYLKKNQDKIIFNVCDSNNFKRNLMLTTELINCGYKIIIVLNMINDIDCFDFENLSKCLNVKIVAVDASRTVYKIRKQ